MRQGQKKKFQSTCFVTYSHVSIARVQLQTLAKMTSAPGPSCGQTWSNVWRLFNESSNHNTGRRSGYR